MKLVFLALLALAVAASAVEFTSETSHSEVVSALDELRAQVATHGVESLFAESASAVEADSDSEADSERRRRRGKRSKKVKVAGPPGIGISFKWSQIDVRNFLSWLVDQDPKTGALTAMQMTSYKGSSGKGKKKLSRKMRAMLKRLRKLKQLPTAGQHGGLWWYKVNCNGACNSGSILNVCKKYRLKPACDHTAYSDGQCVNSQYNHGRHLSYPGHALEGWQHNFFPQCHIYAGMANGGHPLQNTGSTHRWSYGESGNTVCVSSERPQFKLLKKYRGLF